MFVQYNRDNLNGACSACSSEAISIQLGQGEHGSRAPRPSAAGKQINKMLRTNNIITMCRIKTTQ